MKPIRSTLFFLASISLVLMITLPAHADVFRDTVEAAKRRRMGLTKTSVSSVSSVKSSSSSSAMPSVFIPFLKRYLYVEKGWMGKLDKPQSLATFTRTNPPGSFTLALFNHAECDQTQLEKRLAKAWNDAGKPVEGKVSFVGVTGATGIAFIWNEPGPNGTVRNYCMIPEGKVFTARISVLASDTATRRFIERQILQQIFRADRKFQGR